jgi:ApbE superfamily uncharacterized protein (UPF0280 family)
MFQPRRYRDAFAGDDLVYFDCVVRETDLRIGAAKVLRGEALRAVLQVRAELEEYIRSEPGFAGSLEPLDPMPQAPALVRRMCTAARSAGVGPMAAVAGAIAEAVGRELLEYSPEVIVENGGDIFIKIRSVRKIGIYAGPSVLSEKVAIEVRPEDTPLGICTSSGTFGHSLSFGKCDAAVILAPDAALSDAVATATGNRVQSEADVHAAVEWASSIPGVAGILVIKGEMLGAWGQVRLVAM